MARRKQAKQGSEKQGQVRGTGRSARSSTKQRSGGSRSKGSPRGGREGDRSRAGTSASPSSKGGFVSSFSRERNPIPPPLIAGVKSRPANAPAPDGGRIVGVLRESLAGAQVQVLSGAVRGVVDIPRQRLNGAPMGMMVVCRLADPFDSDHPTAEVELVLGPPDRPDVAMEAIFHAHDIPLSFPAEVQAAGEAFPVDPSPEIVAQEIAGGRLDLRTLPTLTIDGLDAKDLDDALSIEALPKGGARLYVHIADVAHYVQENSVIDQEAVKRGTSVYPVDRVIPMLPTRLSNGICSLNPDRDRLALTVILEFDASGRRTLGRVRETVIRSDLRGDYGAIYRSLEAGEPEAGYEKLWPQILAMRKLAKKLTARRRAEGQFAFDFPETKIDLDEEGHPIRIYPYETTYANQLIEEFMVAANAWVAEQFEGINAPFLYRVHEAPDPEKLEKVLTLCRQIGLRVSGRMGKDALALSKLLDQALLLPEGPAVAQVLLRSMAKAHYSPRCLGHYGLALDYYSHFTSPIRRYPDLFIHRVIKGYLHDSVPIKRWRAQAEVLGEQCSLTEREAMLVEYETQDQKLAEYMADRIGETFAGKISGFCGGGFFVQLDNTTEGMVPFRSLPDYFLYDENSLTALGRHCGVKLKIGLPLMVQVARVDTVRRQVDFTLAPEDQTLKQIRKGAGLPLHQVARKGLKKKVIPAEGADKRLKHRPRREEAGVRGHKKSGRRR